MSATSNAVPSPTALTTSRSQPFRASLARPWCSASPESSPVSAAKPTITWPGSRAATNSTSTSGFCVSASGGGSSEPDFLILWSTSDVGRKSATAAVITMASAPLAATCMASRSCSADPTRSDLDGRGIAEVGRVRRDERDRGPALRRDPCERVALPPRGPVAEEADGVERLPGAARRHDDAPPREVAGQRGGPLQEQPGQLGDLGGVRQPSGTGVLAGEAARRGVEHHSAAGAQQRDVGPRSRVFPHLRVHRGREQHRTSRGEQGRGEQVVGAAVRGPRQQVGRRRRDHDQVGLLAQLHVRHRRDVGEDPGVHGLAGERLERGGADELQRRRGGQHPHGVPGLGEPPQQLAGLVGGDAARHPEQYPGGGHAYCSPSVCSSRPDWISRIAMDSGFSRGPGSTSGPTYSSRPSPSCE